MRSAKIARAPVEAGSAGASSRERILQKAERVFGAYGFDGASMRQVAEAADVPVALVSYHFGSKEGLYRAVFERRVPTVVEQRLVGLAIAMSEAALDRRLELVVKALVFPMLHLRAHDRDPSFGRVLAHETMDPSSEQRGFIREMFDPIARAVVELAHLCPSRTDGAGDLVGVRVHARRDGLRDGGRRAHRAVKRRPLSAGRRGGRGPAHGCVSHRRRASRRAAACSEIENNA